MQDKQVCNLCGKELDFFDRQENFSIAFDDAEKIFKSKEAQKFISDKIVNELQREIDKIGTIKIR